MPTSQAVLSSQAESGSVGERGMSMPWRRKNLLVVDLSQTRGEPPTFGLEYKRDPREQTHCSFEWLTVDVGEYAWQNCSVEAGAAVLAHDDRRGVERDRLARLQVGEKCSLREEAGTRGVDVALARAAVLGPHLLTAGVGARRTGGAEELFHLVLLGLLLGPGLLVRDDVPQPSPAAAIAAAAEAAEQEQQDEHRGDAHGRPEDGLAVRCFGERIKNVRNSTKK